MSANGWALWVHCNICYSRPSQASDQFYLNKCGHVYCTKCVKQGGASEMCPKCKKPFSVIALNKHAPPHVANFFKPFADVLKTTTKIAEFQTNNRCKLLNYQENRANVLKSEYKRLLDAYKDLKARTNEIQQKLEAYSENSRRQHSYTRAPHADGFGDMSMGWGNDNMSSVTNPHQTSNQMFSSFNGPMNTSGPRGNLRGSVCSNMSRLYMNPKF